MLLPAPPLFPRKRKGRAKAPSTPPPAALTLVAATYQLDDSPFTVSLEFDRAIDIAAFNGSQVTLNDGGINSVEYRATGPASLLDPTTLVVVLEEIDSYVGPDELLTASSATGIVAVDDGGAWAGVTDLVLPFP